MAKEEWGQSGWGGMDDYSKDKTPNDLGRKKFYMKNGETRRTSSATCSTSGPTPRP